VTWYYEPSPQNRQQAIGLRRIYNAFTEAGFTDEQAMEFVVLLLDRALDS
jgi:hypothetical protein